MIHVTQWSLEPWPYVAMNHVTYGLWEIRCLWYWTWAWNIIRFIIHPQFLKVCWVTGQWILTHDSRDASSIGYHFEKWLIEPPPALPPVERGWLMAFPSPPFPSPSKRPMCSFTYESTGRENEAFLWRPRFEPRTSRLADQTGLKRRSS